MPWPPVARRSSPAARSRTLGALTAQVAALTASEYPEGRHLANDEAFIVLSQWHEVERYLERRPLWRLLSMGRGGQNVQRIGRVGDIRDAADSDRFKVVAELS